MVQQSHRLLTRQPVVKMESIPSTPHRPRARNNKRASLPPLNGSSPPVKLRALNGDAPPLNVSSPLAPTQTTVCFRLRGFLIFADFNYGECRILAFSHDQWRRTLRRAFGRFFR